MSTQVEVYANTEVEIYANTQVEPQASTHVEIKHSIVEIHTNTKIEFSVIRKSSEQNVLLAETKLPNTTKLPWKNLNGYSKLTIIGKIPSNFGRFCIYLKTL